MLVKIVANTRCLKHPVHPFYLASMLEKSILEKNVSDKSYGVLNNLFSDQSDLGTDQKSKQYHFEFFKWNFLFFIIYSCSTS